MSARYQTTGRSAKGSAGGAAHLLGALFILAGVILISAVWSAQTGRQAVAQPLHHAKTDVVEHLTLTEQPKVIYRFGPQAKNSMGKALDTGDLSNIHPKDYVGPQACGECHQSNYKTWSEHPHRWMNAPANATTVKGDFSNRKINYYGGEVTFYMEDDHRMMLLVRGSIRRVYRITQTLGSRFFQYYIGLQIEGPEPRSHRIYHSEHVLEFGYWIEYRQWVPVVHIIGNVRDDEPSPRDAQRRDPFADPLTLNYAESCSKCHTTLPAGDRLVHRLEESEPGSPHSPRGFAFEMVPYIADAHPEIVSRPEVLATTSRKVIDHLADRVKQIKAPVWQVTSGITCEVCHYGGRFHLEDPEDMMPMFFPTSPHLRIEDEGQPADEALGRTRANQNWTCARCHVGPRPQYAAGMSTWNSVEYSDAKKGACYVAPEGQRHLTCTDCHDPHVAIGPKWSGTADQDDALCLKCHGQFRDVDSRQAHTHHSLGSTGSRCMECHMPRLNEGLQDMVRTHMIFSPTNAEMIEANEPNACNMCHVDKSIDWTLQYLQQWYAKTYDSDQIDAAYGPESRGTPATLGWLKSWFPPTQLVAVDALTRAKAQWALPELLGMLDHKVLINRQFALVGLQRMLGLDLGEYGYRFYMFKEERKQPLIKLRADLLGEIAATQTQAQDPALDRQRDLQERISHFRKMVAARPDSGQGHLNLGNALAENGDLEGAIAQYRQALRIEPEVAPVHAAIGSWLVTVDRPVEGLFHLRKAVKISPNGPLLRNKLAWTLASHVSREVRNVNEAIEHAQAAVRLTEASDPGVLDTLAVAYAAAGRFDEAVATAEKALNLTENPQSESLAREIGQRLKLFRQRKPYRE